MSSTKNIDVLGGTTLAGFAGVMRMLRGQGLPTKPPTPKPTQSAAATVRDIGKKGQGPYSKVLNGKIPSSKQSRITRTVTGIVPGQAGVEAAAGVLALQQALKDAFQ
jgi:hypothetical protein